MGNNILGYKLLIGHSREIIGYKSIVIYGNNIASVAINEDILFADVAIESKGGQKLRQEGLKNRMQKK
ncbi:MAG: hypothetical protein LBE13_00300 [Bacteroidales bacterium]|jgi:hypothetical protein|nr:hypothetical protein [Bacteroidales bacterium]